MEIERRGHTGRCSWVRKYGIEKGRKENLAKIIADRAAERRKGKNDVEGDEWEYKDGMWIGGGREQGEKWKTS